MFPQGGDCLRCGNKAPHVIHMWNTRLKTGVRRPVVQQGEGDLDDDWRMTRGRGWPFIGGELFGWSRGKLWDWASRVPRWRIIKRRRPDGPEPERSRAGLTEEIVASDVGGSAYGDVIPSPGGSGFVTHQLLFYTNEIAHKVLNRLCVAGIVNR